MFRIQIIFIWIQIPDPQIHMVIKRILIRHIIEKFNIIFYKSKKIIFDFYKIFLNLFFRVNVFDWPMVLVKFELNCSGSETLVYIVFCRLLKGSTMCWLVSRSSRSTSRGLSRRRWENFCISRIRSRHSIGTRAFS